MTPEELHTLYNLYREWIKFHFPNQYTDMPLYSDTLQIEYMIERDLNPNIDQNGIAHGA